MSVADEIPPSQLAQIDQWYATHKNNIAGLIAAAHRDIVREEPVSRAVEAYLLSSVIRDHIVEKHGVADLLAVALIRIVRGGDS